MRIINLGFLLLAIALANCNNQNKNKILTCVQKTYSNIDDALTCGGDPENYKLFLFAFASSNLGQEQKKGWAILEDEEIIETAKQHYVLIVIDPKQIDFSKYPETTEFQNIINSQKEPSFFIVTNRVLYPFRNFTLKTDKNRIIHELELGDGP